jgi:hypothetical protein
MGNYFLSIFIVSGVARLAVVLFFLPRIKEVRKVPQVKAGELLFSDFQSAWFKRAYSYIAEHLHRRKMD